MKTISTGQGYLICDDTSSGGKRVEADMLGCNHCQALVKKHEWRQDGAFCHACDAPICGACGDRMAIHGCENFMRKLEQAVTELHRRQQNARILGI